MENNLWHSSFDPRKFLSKVNVDKLIEHNEAYNENKVEQSNKPCILCGGFDSPGLLLNDKSYLCKNCFTDVSAITYPEKYERLRREYIKAVEARRIANLEFRKTYEYKKQGNPFTGFAWLSVFLIFVNIGFVLLTAILFFASHIIEKEQNKKLVLWEKQLEEWEQSYPEPDKPLLRHFHDPLAELSSRDRSILKIFNNWPGYPPFWGYLRDVVVARDNSRCQVTGCPSRLSLHVHHKTSVSRGGEHIPDNLVALCDFHHALEPDEGHERIWGNVNTRYFTLVREHVRHNRSNDGIHEVSSHLRRLELISLDEMKNLHDIYGYSCSNCHSQGLKFTLMSERNKIQVLCKECGNGWEGPQQLTEEVGPKLAEVLVVTKNMGIWKPRWDMLASRKESAFKSFVLNPTKMKKKQNKARKAYSDYAPPPNCPKCGSPMRLVKPMSDQKWKEFWGCSKYKITGCRGSIDV